MTGEPVLRLAVAARVVALSALTAPVLAARDGRAVVALLAIGAVWALALPLRRLGAAATALEGVAVGVLCALAPPAVLGALALPPFTAGLCRGARGVVASVAAEVAALLVVLPMWHPVGPTQAYAAGSWAFTGLGLGLIGAFLHGPVGRASDPLAPYHHARSLLRRLISVSEGLDPGLDPVSLGETILATVADALPAEALALYVRRGEGLTPLVTRSLAAADADLCEPMVAECAALASPLVLDDCFAFPLTTDAGGARTDVRGAGVVGVVAGTLSEGVGLDLAGTVRGRQLVERLRPSAVHLDTALLFAALRDAATADERRRLAREMHDGVAQELASLGYLVDALAAGTTETDQLARVRVLRERVTAIVAEVRRSLLSLRTTAAGSESLGAALAGVARSLSEVSGIPIHVTVDEHTDRLRPEVEDELFRIAQEAVNNAVKHAAASAIRVHCQVRAPAARITVSDDGHGFRGPRPGSHGLSIMRERARLVGAVLALGETPGGGLTVTVSIPAELPVPRPRSDEPTPRSRRPERPSTVVGA